MPAWLQALLLILLVAASSLAVFRDAGMLVFFVVLVVAAILYKLRDPLMLLLLLVLGTIVVLFLLPAVQTAGEASPRASCTNNLHQISLAVLQYESQYHCFPPPYIADKNGKPMHSWRVLILPYLGREDIYGQYDFNEPWDGPKNRKLLAIRPRVFACPADRIASKADATTTSYVAVVGRIALWRTDKPKSLNDPELSGRAGNTVMLVETADSDINWTEPRDYCLDEPTPEGSASIAGIVSSRHMSSPGFFYQDVPAGVNVSFADGHQQFVSAAAMTSDRAREWLAVGGFKDEAIDYSAPGYERQINWANCFALAVWIVSVALLLVRAWCSRRLALIDGPADETPPPESQVVEDHPESTNDRIAGS